MPSRSFALEPGGPKRLTVSWTGGWKNVAVQRDGKSVLTIPTWKELKTGREVPLEPGMVTPPVGPILVKRLFLVYMSRGFGAIRDLRSETWRVAAGSATGSKGTGSQTSEACGSAGLVPRGFLSRGPP